MSDKPTAATTLDVLLATTQDEEIDCDRVLDLLPAYLDGRISDASLRAQIVLHEKHCPECAEEIAILRRALEP